MKKLIAASIALLSLTAAAESYKYYHLPSKKEHVIHQIENCAKTYTTDDDSLKYHYIRWFNTCIENQMENAERFGVTKEEIKEAVYRGSRDEEKSINKEKDKDLFLEELNEIRYSN